MNKYGIRTLGILALAALSLLLFVATAQAENLGTGGVAGKIKIEGLEALATGATFTGQIESLTGTSPVHMVLLIPGIKANILCAGSDVIEGKLISTNEGLLKFKYLGCVYRQRIGAKEEEEGKEGAEIKTCTITDSEGKAGGIIVTTVFLPKLHEVSPGVSELYVLFEGEPIKGGGTEALATVKTTGAECPLPASAAITGSVVGLVKNGNIEEVTKLVSFTDAIQLLFQIRNEKNEFVQGDRLLFGANEAILDGNVTASLTGIHVGITWSVI
jgi:hypothetical protein